MATLAAVFVETSGGGQPIPQGPFHVEVWRVPGATAGDTSVITPKRGRFVVSAFGAAANNLSLPTAATVVFTNYTAVTVTALASPGTALNFDVYLMVQD